MVQRKRIQSLARISVAPLIGVVLGACSAGSCPAPTAHTPDRPTRDSDGADSGSVLPEIVVTAPRLSSPRVVEENSSPRPAKRRGG